jgi:hypothetical protein
VLSILEMQVSLVLSMLEMQDTTQTTTRRYKCSLLSMF